MTRVELMSLASDDLIQNGSLPKQKSSKTFLLAV